MHRLHNRSNSAPTDTRSPVHTGATRRTPNRSTNCVCRARTTSSFPYTVNERYTPRPAWFVPTVTRTSHTPGCRSRRDPPPRAHRGAPHWQGRHNSTDSCMPER